MSTNTLICFFLINIIFGQLSANLVYEKLDTRIKKTSSFVCVGLDPDLKKIPLEYQNEEKVGNFLKEIIQITAPNVCAYKIQKAFFDKLENGHSILRETCKYLLDYYPEIPIFIDCKIGDIDNTMEAYMDLLFGEFNAQGVVINPYMGDDVFQPFLEDPKKTAIVLIQTSNPNARIVQEMRIENGNFLWEELLNLMLQRWNTNHNMIPVLSSHSSIEHYMEIRKRIPDNMPILLAGVGMQGGNPAVLKTLLNTQKRGVFVNSSRGILYPYSPSEPKWREKVHTAVKALQEKLNQIGEVK